MNAVGMRNAAISSDPMKRCQPSTSSTLPTSIITPVILTMAVAAGTFFDATYRAIMEVFVRCPHPLEKKMLVKIRRDTTCSHGMSTMYIRPPECRSGLRSAACGERPGKRGLRLARRRVQRDRPEGADRRNLGG